MKNNVSIVISCAGMGTRLGLGCTKALVEIEGKTLIERQLEILKDYDDIRIVVGYQAEQVIDVVNAIRKDVLFVFNHDYRNTGTGASFTLGAKYGREYVVALDGDLLVHPDDLIAGIEYDGNDGFVGILHQHLFFLRVMDDLFILVGQCTTLHIQCVAQINWVSQDVCHSSTCPSVRPGSV